jgi:hypothetical protein
VTALNMGRRALAPIRVLLKLVVRWSNLDVRAPVPCGRLSTIIRRFTLHRGHRCITIRATVQAGRISFGVPAMGGAYISSFLETYIACTECIAITFSLGVTSRGYFWIGSNLSRPA